MSKEAPSRPMKYPYTFTSKVVQFPLKYYIKNQWVWRYYLISIALCTPIFMKISSISNSPENVRAFEEAKRKELAEHHH